MRTRQSDQRGFTLIELLVVVFVIGILIALLLPAVQSARGASRRIQCASQLKNIGLAIHQHAEVHRTFPSGFGRHPGNASYLFQILPYIEQHVLYDSVNMAEDAMSNPNATVLLQIPGIFLCPSDARRSMETTTNATNYAGNGGYGGNVNMRGDGVFVGSLGLSPRDVTDGLSQTMAAAEWIVGAGDLSAATRLGSIHRLRGVFTEAPSDREAFARACESLDPADIVGIVAAKGQFWLDGTMGFSRYNHELPPGWPSCVAQQDRNAVTAGSFHGNGCHALSLDGAVHFVIDTVDPHVWRSLGTRAGAETIDNGSY